MSNYIAVLPLGPAIKLSNDRSLSNVYPNLASLINIIVPNLFVLAGVLFLFLLILGGFSIIYSDSTKGVEEGKKKITTAVLGFLVMFSAYWIIQIVTFVTGVQIF